MCSESHSQRRPQISLTRRGWHPSPPYHTQGRGNAYGTNKSGQQCAEQGVKSRYIVSITGSSGSGSDHERY